MELDAFQLLRVADDAEEIAALRIAARAEHADEALRLRPRRLAKLLEADCRLDAFAQNRLAGVDIAGDAIRFCISSLKLPVSAISSLHASFIAPFFGSPSPHSQPYPSNGSPQEAAGL